MIKFETDSKIAYSAISSIEEDSSELELITAKCKIILESNKSFKVKHISHFTKLSMYHDSSYV